MQFTLTLQRRKMKRKTYNLLRVLLALVISISTYSFTRAQSGPGANKIDPVFRNIISRMRPNDCSQISAKKIAAPQRRKKTIIRQTPAPEKRYDCVIYTKDAQRLREKGVVVNSVLPSFVTASATLCQILQLSALSYVSYIEAPRRDDLH